MSSLLLVVALAAGLIVSIYPRYAPKRGWRVLPDFRKSGGSIMTIGLASMIGAAILITADADVWWHVVASAMGAVLLAFALMHVLKSSVQRTAFVLIGVAWMWYLLERAA